MTAIPTLEADPCGRVKALREVRDKVVTGGQIVEGEFEQGNGTRRRMKYSGADLGRLDKMIAEAAAACANLGGVCRPTRFAIGGRMS
ncbi:hypothetical protein PCC82_06470 [Agrobacterium deltaense]